MMLIRDYGLTQEEVADKVSKSRTTITNALRLLKLAEGARELLMEGKISSGHARALLAVEDEDDQDALAERIVKEMLSVREVEKLVKQAKKKRKERKESCGGNSGFEFCTIRTMRTRCEAYLARRFTSTAVD